MPAITGTIRDPDFRHRRAQYAARKRTEPDHHIAKLADVAGDLTDEQARRLVAVLNLWAGRTSTVDGGGPRAA
jgi:hypothetical protein